MKLLKRNLTWFEYLPFTGEETDIDPETGLHTGEFRKAQGEPVEYEGNISPASLLANQQFYGLDTRYTHVLVMDDPEAEIDEYGTILWEGEEYEIRAVRRSLNVLSLALRKQTRHHEEEEPEPNPDTEPEDPETEPDGEGWDDEP